MEKIVKTVTAIMILSLIALSFHYPNVLKDEQSIEILFEAKKSTIEWKDEKKIDAFSNKLLKEIEIHKKSINQSIDKIKSIVCPPQIDQNKKNRDSLKKKLLNDLSTSIKISHDSLKKRNIEYLIMLQHDKNQIVFEYEKSKLNATPKINIWVILLIILSAGIIGGWARTKYSYLVDLEINLNNLDKTMKNITSRMSGIQRSGRNDENDTDATENTEQNIKKLNSEIENIVKQTKEDPNEQEYVNIVFGVIAASISILFLKISDSQVLKFESITDYFELWAWCLLGALYAKNTLIRIYNGRFNGKKIPS